jgi:hypothetical protein
MQRTFALHITVFASRVRLLFALATVLGVVVTSTSLHDAHAQQPDVRIEELQCNASPEVVTISNAGSNAQDLTGWTLRSDPIGTEVFDLSALGTIGPGVSVFVQAGPTAEGTFVWSESFVFRDSDANDFARIVDANENVVHEVKCQAGSPAASPTRTVAPTAAPTTAPTAAQTPTAAPADGVPIGGGPPGADSWRPAGLLFVAGVWLLAATLGALVLMRIRQGNRPVLLGVEAPEIAETAPRTASQGRLFYVLLLLLVAAAASLAFGSERDRPGGS